MYHNGYGTTKNCKEAFKWLKLSADQGNSRGMQNLHTLLMDTKSMTELVTNFIAEVSALELRYKEVIKVNEHLKLYPGNDYIEAMRDFNLLSSNT